MSDVIWKRIPGYPGFIASNKGIIKSPRGKTLSTHVQKNGYLTFHIRSEDGKWVTRYVHRIIALAFIELKKGKNSINHKDGDKFNNCESNLEWVSPKENTDHGRKLGLFSDTKSVRVVKGEMIRKYSSLSSASRDLGIPLTSCHRLAKGLNSKSHKGYRFEYVD